MMSWLLFFFLEPGMYILHFYELGLRSQVISIYKFRITLPKTMKKSLKLKPNYGFTIILFSNLLVIFRVRTKQCTDSTLKKRVQGMQKLGGINSSVHAILRVGGFSFRPMHTIFHYTKGCASQRKVSMLPSIKRPKSMLDRYWNKKERSEQVNNKLDKLFFMLVLYKIIVKPLLSLDISTWNDIFFSETDALSTLWSYLLWLSKVDYSTFLCHIIMLYLEMLVEGDSRHAATNLDFKGLWAMHADTCGTWWYSLAFSLDMACSKAPTVPITIHKKSP